MACDKLHKEKAIGEMFPSLTAVILQKNEANLQDDVVIVLIGGNKAKRAEGQASSILGKG